LWKVSKWRPGFRFSKKHFNELFSFGINIVGNDVLDFLNRHTDDILIGIYLGPVMLGFYTVAYKIITIMTALLTGVISAVAFPAFSLIQNDLDRMRRGFYQAIHYISLISFPAFIGVTLLAPELVTTVFGPQWLLSIPVMQILAFIGILHSVFIFNGDIILASGKPSWRLGLTLMNAITNVIAFALVVQWGIVAVAAVYVIRGYLVSPINLYVVKRLIGIEFKTYFNQFKEALVSTVAMAIALIGLKQFDIINGLRPYLQLIIYTFFGACVYLLIIQAMVPNFWGQLSGFATSVFPNLRPKKIGRES
jgi:PST family polysaccharide transporter